MRVCGNCCNGDEDNPHVAENGNSYTIFNQMRAAHSQTAFLQLRKFKLRKLKLGSPIPVVNAE
jgi:hypothetical protein